MCATCGCNSDNPAMITNVNELTVSHENHHDHHHEHFPKEKTVIDLERDVLEKNNRLAERLRGFFVAKNIFVLNLVSSPGSGKTTLLEKTLAKLKNEIPCAVIEGDQQTSFDAERIHALGIPVTQINTGSGCHLDAEMIHNAVRGMNLADNSILFIENVGNLVCPAMFDLGENARVVIMSVTEGDDKPAKYPDMFHSSNLCVINKIDLLPYVNFNLERCKDFLQRVTHNIDSIELSATRGDGIDLWLQWLMEGGIHLNMRKHTFHIHIEGRVQGVGFRPHVYRIAQQHQLNGWVCNDVDGVHIEVNAEPEEATKFCEEVITSAPNIATITQHSLQEVPLTEFDKFFIKESSSNAKPNLLLTPDLGICDECREEIHSTSSRRFQYPFTTCTQCGPRYSIIAGLPYDRERTTMEYFKMCESCGREYQDINDRRYFSQTNSCPDCAVHLWLTDNAGSRINDDPHQAILQTANFIRDGKIIAVKGIGGFLLMSDARNENAIRTLRNRKHRPTKPFALMYPSLQLLKEDCLVSEEEAAAFISIESLIVLVRMKPERKNEIAFDAVAPNLSRIGAMNAYSPLFELLMKELNSPIIATSGNLSGSPIYYENESAFENLKHLADYFLMNDRDIVVPQDDSVIQFTSDSKQKIILRRSRGLAPSFLHKAWKEFNEEIFSAGADLKSAFTLQHAGKTYTSQFLGDLENFDSQLSYRKVLNHLLQLLKMKPSFVIRDLHPHYFSSAIAEEFAQESNIPVVTVQHHEAHFAAALGENELLDSNENILGVIWDGLGFGNDGSIRGGELFLFEKQKINHVASTESFPYLLGDKMSKEPRLSALAIASQFPEAQKILHAQFSEQEWNFLQKVLAQKSHPASTSMGRLFDAVASLLGITSFNTFEGEAAMQLENLAASSSRQEWKPFDIQNASVENFPTSSIIQQIISEINRQEDRSWIALRFHQTLVSWIEHAANFFNAKHLAFSGGVFQNALLIDLIIKRLKSNFNLHFHKQLSPNDECISFGQLATYYLQDKTT